MSSPNDWAEYVYNEMRYYDRTTTPMKGYDAIVELSTKIQNGSVENTIVPRSLINYFSLTNFNDAVLRNPNMKLKIPVSVYSTNSNRDQMWSSVITENPLLEQYYNGIDAIVTGDTLDSDVLTTFLKDTAKLIVQFFTYSSILYATMYFGESLVTSLPASNPTLAEQSIRERHPYLTSLVISGALTSAHRPSDPALSPSLNLESIIRAVYNIEENMNVRSSVFNANVTNNIRENNKFINQDALLKIKQSQFEKNRNYLVTLIQKNKNVNEQYTNKQYWFNVYIVLLSVLFVLNVAILSNNSTNLIGSSMGNMGSYGVIGISATVLLIIIIRDIVNYIF
jgi:hypothetical protein